MNNTAFSALSHRRRLRVITFAVSLVMMGSIIYFAVVRGAAIIRRRGIRTEKTISAKELWHTGQYAALVEIAEQQLLTDPLNRDALLFAGYSRYFLAISRQSSEERISDLDYSIRHLRVLLARRDMPNPERIYYVLGKAYLTKGKYWSDLAVHYLMLAEKGNYAAEDLFEYLGRAYFAVGDVESALSWYLKALEQHPAEKLLLTIGEASFQLGRYDEAVLYYRRAIDGSRDDILKKKGLFQLGKLYYDVGNYKLAAEVLELLVRMESDNENYLFLFAETLYANGARDAARRYWRRVEKLNPQHTGALRRLYN